ncbi:histidine phosphatase family protein [Spirillospora sp. CA-294931]|uniref:histidine phosphatase family protein n=1 Tax=Spirillospora sp. CA-294931 TaxID=3240042 RepID=UPI003D8B39AC
MTTLLLVRHGLTAMTGPVLAGWTPDVHLNDGGRAQVRDLAARLTGVPLAAVVSSPLDRCVETAEAITGDGGKIELDDRFGEVRYGDWTGRPLKELAEEPLWKVVQAHPSAARFPGGEGLAEAQARAVAGVREWNARIAAEHGDDALYLVCSHGDIIKAIVADALGLHLDQFQRINAAPASLTVIRYTELRPFVLRVNDTGGRVDDLLPGPARGDGDAPVGGGA